METNETPEASASTPNNETKIAVVEPEAEAEVIEKKEHAIALAINNFLHRVRDIEVAAGIYISLSSRRRLRNFRRLIRELEKGEELLKDDAQSFQILGMTRTLEAVRKLERIKQSNVPRILETSLFLGLFSSYDAFTGDLLTAIYSKKPELFNNVNRSVPVSEILQYRSFDELKDAVLQSEIELFRRKSYVEQFEHLQSTFGIELKTFERWPQFVECGQRRNLITHCGGVVSEQYINVCIKEGHSFSKSVGVGDSLELGAEYFLTSCELMMEVGLKLSHTLWRKLFARELAEADDHLIEVVYTDCLQTEAWSRGIVFGEFAINQKKWSSDLRRKTSIINYAISLKFSGKSAEAQKILATVDWSAAINDFRIAEAVLLDRFDEAANIMERIGKDSEMVSEYAYHHWPLFREFRTSDQFLKAYENIYGYPFAVELQRTADKTQAEATKEFEKQEQEIQSISPNETENENSNDKEGKAP